MKKKFLLVSPRTGFDAPKPQMPSAMVYLGTNLKKAGYDPVIVDARVEKDYVEKIQRDIKDSLAVGLTAMTGTQIIFALRLAKLVRKLDPKMPIIWGGVHASLFPEQTIKNELVDAILIGEGDKAVVEIAKRLEKGESLEGVKGLFCKKDGIIHRGSCFELLDVNELPVPDWSLIDVKKYRIFDVQSARGCPHRCGFCYNQTFNKGRWRMRSAKSVIDEIENLIKKYGIKEVNFIDDNFFTHKGRADEMLNLILEKKLKFTWRINCRADYFDRFDEDFLKKAHKAGLREVLIGCESGSQDVLDYIQKDIRVHQIVNAITLCKKVGLEAQCSFMIGLPEETGRDLNMTFDLIDKLREIDPKVVITALSIYTPYPGSKLFDISKGHGFVAPKSLEEWGEFTYTFVNVPWLKGMKKAKYESMSYVSRFLFDRKKMRKRFITPLIKIPYELMVLDARLRWKFRFFDFPFEWMLVKKYLVSKREKQLAEVLND